MASQANPAQIVHVPFVGGLDEHSDTRLIQTTRLRELKNGRIDKPGRVAKRYGTTAASTVTYDPVPWGAPTTGTLLASGTGSKVATFEDQVLVADGTYMRALSGATLTAVGQTPEAVIDRTSIAPVKGNSSYLTASCGGNCLDVAASATHYAFVWLDSAFSGTAWLLMRDRTTGAVTFSGALNSGLGSANPRVCYCSASGNFVITVQDVASAAVILYSSTDGKTIAVIGAGVTIKAATNYEIATDGTSVYLLYQLTANFVLRLIKFNGATGAVTTASVVVGEADVLQKTGLSLCIGDKVYMGYVIDGGAGVQQTLKFAVADPTTLVTSAGPTNLYNSAGSLVYFSGICYAGSGAANYVYTVARAAASAAPGCQGAKVTNAGAITAQTKLTYWTTIQSKPFMAGGKCYAWALAGAAGAYSLPCTLNSGLPGSALASYVLCDTQLSAVATHPDFPWRPVAVASPRQARGLLLGSTLGTAVDALPTSTPSIGANGDIAAFMRAEFDNAGAATLDLVVSRFDQAHMWSKTELGLSCNFSGGFLGHFDGSRFAELGFLFDPYCAATVAYDNLGGMAVGDKYAYRFVYSYTDARGQIHRSGPSYGTPGTNYTTADTVGTVPAANSEIILNIPTYTLTGRSAFTSFKNPTKQWIDVYRTPNIKTVASDVFSYIGSVLNDETVETVQFKDYGVVTDSAPARIYTYGGAVFNVCPPCTLHVCQHKGRLFAVEKDRIWFTKQFVDGEAPAFADEFTFSMPGGELVGLASLDDKLVIFGKSRIWVLFGDGPNDTLTVNDYTQPVPVASDVGCLDARTIVVYPGGVAFSSQTGIQTLNRSLQLEFIGEGVVDTTDAYAVIGATLQPRQHVIQFVIASAEPAQILVYDYHHNIWSRDTHAAPVYSLAVSRTGVLYKLFQTSLDKEDPATWKDKGAWVTMSVSLNWFQPTGLQGYSRIRKLAFMGEFVDKHGLTLSAYSNYGTVTPDQTAVYTTTDIATKVDANSGLWEQEISVNNPLVRSVSLTLTDSDPSVTATGQGSRFIGVVIEFTPEVGVYRKPDAQKG